MILSPPRTLLAGACALVLVACASGPKPPASERDGMLVGPNKMTLYTFDRDTTAGKSACNGPCAANWPPLTAPAGASVFGDWSLLTRDDGTLQWAYKSKPLYYWVKDAKPGDKTGDGINNAWRIARP